MKQSDHIIQPLKDCRAGERIHLVFTPQASVYVLSEAEYQRWEAAGRGGYLWCLTPDNETDNESTYTIPADGRYYLCMEPYDDCPHPELKSVERIPVDSFVFNGHNAKQKIVRRLSDAEASPCSKATWQRKTGMELRDPWVCWSCRSMRPSSDFLCIPVKIASVLEPGTYSVPVCSDCYHHPSRHAFMVPTNMLVPTIQSSNLHSVAK